MGSGGPGSIARDGPGKHRPFEAGKSPAKIGPGGRPPRIDMQAIKHRLSMGLSPTTIAHELGVSRGTVYKAKAELKDIA